MLPIGETSMTLAIPTILGMSLDDYYTDSDGDNAFFGYASIGAELSIPLPVPEKYGAWSFITSITYYQLCADSTQAANDDENYAFVGRVGVSLAY